MAAFVKTVNASLVYREVIALVSYSLATSMPRAKSIVFFHPDLGIGGAERLVIDGAVGLQNLGHKVTIFTCHCDPSHCFDEARDGLL